VGPVFVVIPAPGSDDASCFEEVLEPVDAQALLAQLAVEALHKGVLRGLTGLDVNQLDLAIQGPGKEVTTSQLRAIVTANRLWQCACRDDLVKYVCNTQTGEAGVHLHNQALSRVSIDHVEHAD
jgi:hypothetical protein